MRGGFGDRWYQFWLRLIAKTPAYTDLAGAQGAYAFQQDFRDSGLRWLLYASFAGLVASLAFLAIDSLTLAESGSVTYLRALIACVLLFFGFCTVRFRAWVLKYYDRFVSLVLCVVLLGVIGIVGTPGVVAVGDGFSVGPMLVFCLFMIYGFVRLPLLVLVAMCCLFTAWVLVLEGRWSEGAAFHRLVLYAVLTNLFGVLLAFFIVRREYLLFRERERLELSREGIRQRAAALQASRDDMRRLMRAVDHDLKQPLLAADISVNALGKAIGAGDSGKCLECLDNLTRIVSFLRSSAEDVLCLAAIEEAVPSDLSAVDLHSVVHDVIAICSSLAQSERVTLSSRVSSGPLIINSNQAVISRALLNLVVNAVKFTAASGVEGGRVLVVARRFKDRLRLGVYDQGPGVEEADHERIWEPFFRVSSAKSVDGSGLGLYLVRRMVRGLSGHSLEMRSRLGRGSYFGITAFSGRADVGGCVYPSGGAQFPRVVGAYVIVFTYSEALAERVIAAFRDIGADVDVAVGGGSLLALIGEVERMVDCVVFVSCDEPALRGWNEVQEFRRLIDGCFPVGLVGSSGRLLPAEVECGDKFLDVASESFCDDMARLVALGVARNVEIEAKS